MKFLFLLVVAAIFAISSCHPANQPGNGAASKDSALSPKSGTPAATSLSEREKLMRALQQLQQDVAGKNKEAITAYFPFPVESDALQVFDVGESFDKAVEHNNHRVSKQLFLAHFTSIYDNLEMQGFTDLFAHLPLSALQDTATKEITANKSDGICNHFYYITVAGKEVTLQYGVTTDEQYIRKHPNADMECPEYAAIWTFIFDGVKLIFDHHQVAG